MNFRLRLAVQKARDSNMPADNIERAIKRAVGGADAERQEVVYEGYGPGGIAIMVETLTDNRNRTVAELRSPSRGAAAIWASPAPSPGVREPRRGQRQRRRARPDEITLAAIDAGADDVEVADSAVKESPPSRATWRRCARRCSTPATR
ncbi:MAG: YebC/PmpR family DNA-binding transcriptional regulator [Dehalococcoidia bacterium]